MVQVYVTGDNVNEKKPQTPSSRFQLFISYAYVVVKEDKIKMRSLFVLRFAMQIASRATDTAQPNHFFFYHSLFSIFFSSYPRPKSESSASGLNECEQKQELVYNMLTLHMGGRFYLVLN